MLKTNFIITTNLIILLFGGFVLIGCLTDNEPKPGNYFDFVSSFDSEPAFSQNGQFIAYTHMAFPEDPDYLNGLYVIDDNGENRKLIIKGIHSHPSWSHDGEWLVFSSGGLLQKIKINGDSLTTFSGLDGNPDTFSDALFFPFWSPSGEKILFDRAVNIEDESNLYSIDIDFSEVEPICGNVVIAGRSPEVSESGILLFIQYSTEWSFGQVLSLNTATNETLRLTFDGDNRDPTWSPTGMQIAWSKNVEIHVMDNDGSGSKFLHPRQYPSWSPDGKIVFSFANPEYTKEVLYTIDPDGSNLTQLTN